jgi:hypothetical protein
MKWSTVAADWPAFTESIMSTWPELDQETVEDMEGDRRAFRAHVMEATGEDAETVDEQIREWLEAGVPLDAMMDETRDDKQIAESGRFIPAGEDVYSDDAAFGDDDVPDRPMGRD